MIDMTSEITVDIRNDGRGTVHVHRAGCADLRQAKFRAMISHGSAWTAQVRSEQDVVLNVYPPEDFDYDATTQWQDFADDLRFYPCLDGLPTT